MRKGGTLAIFVFPARMNAARHEQPGNGPLTRA